MLSFENLSDLDFERLASDILSRQLGQPLRVFRSGKDRGVDATNSDLSNTIIMQAKHYVNSRPADLVRAMREELPKIKKLAPKEYYLVTSLSLSQKNIQDIYTLFADYMSSPANIITREELNNFLLAEENSDLFRKYFQLWLNAGIILDQHFAKDIWIDAQDLLERIKLKSNYYVYTDSYTQAYEQLLENHALLLLGLPGVGKTTTCEMIIAKLANSGYKVRYSTDTFNLGQFKKSLSENPELKEVIFLDDCFGQCYFKLKSSQASELLALLNFVKVNPNKLLLLNSRVTIYNEVKYQSDNFTTAIAYQHLPIMVLTTEQLTYAERLRIFLNHLLQNPLAIKSFNLLKAEQIAEILTHTNFNPRIIDFVTRSEIFKSISAEQYGNFCLEQLRYPEQIWLNEFEQRLQNTDRILLTTLFSLTDTHISEDLLQKCFNARIAKLPNIDHTINQYNLAIKRLSASCVTFYDYDGKKEVGVINPSVNDFLRDYLHNNQNEREELEKSIITASQLIRYHNIFNNMWLSCDSIHISSLHPDIEARFNDGSILDLAYASEEEKWQFIVFGVVYYQILDARYQKYVHQYVKHAKDISVYDLHMMVSEINDFIFRKNTIEFYHLEDLLMDDVILHSIIQDLFLEDLLDLIRNIYYLFQNPECWDGFVNLCKPYIIDADFEYRTEEILRIDNELYALNVLENYPQKMSKAQIKRATRELDLYLRGYLVINYDNITSCLPMDIKEILESKECDSGYDTFAEAFVKSYIKNGSTYIARHCRQNRGNRLDAESSDD